MDVSPHSFRFYILLHGWDAPPFAHHYCRFSHFGPHVAPYKRPHLGINISAFHTHISFMNMYHWLHGAAHASLVSGETGARVCAPTFRACFQRAAPTVSLQTSWAGTTVRRTAANVALRHLFALLSYRLSDRAFAAPTAYTHHTRPPACAPTTHLFCHTTYTLSTMPFTLHTLPHFHHFLHAKHLICTPTTGTN